MPPLLALAIWAILLILLLRFDPAAEVRTSPSLWVPVTWMFLEASRLPSQWISGQTGLSAKAFEDGDPLDRVVLSVLILLAISILISRSFQWGRFLSYNRALIVFLSFALLSVVWSDFPFVALKRWVRDLGPYLIALVILSTPRPLEAACTVLRRVGYIYIPLCILLNKYFPQVSTHYDTWTGTRELAGATTSKNMLGVSCLVLALFYFWDILSHWHQPRGRQTRRIITVDIAFLIMLLWLLAGARSTTSNVCTVLGCSVIIAAHSKTFTARLSVLRFLIPAAFCLYLLLDFGFGLNGSMASAVGKDPTLTDRTLIWDFLIGMHTNPLIGTGYRSFWLGPRLEYFWSVSRLGSLNEAHNGYLEIYLELGLIGTFLFCVFLIAGYWNIWKKVQGASSFGVFCASIWMVAVFYNMSEAGFGGGILYIVLLFGAISVPARTHRLLTAGIQAPKSGRDAIDELASVELNHRWKRGTWGAL